MSDNKVVELNAPLHGFIEPDKILDMAKNANLEEAVVVGYLKGGGLFLSSSNESLESVLTALRLAERRTLSEIESLMDLETDG